MSFSLATKGSDDHSLAEAGTTSVWPDKIIPPPFILFFPEIVENKLTLCLALSKVLKDVPPSYPNFFSQYSINLRLAEPDTV